MSLRESLDRLREELRQPPASGQSVGPFGSEVERIVAAARSQLDQRVRAVGTAPQWTELSSIRAGAAGVSLLLDVVGLSAEYGIRVLGRSGMELDRRAHGLVDLWGRAESARALLVELFELWPAGPPRERIAALKDGVEAVASDCVARAFEGSLNPAQLVDFIKEMGVGGHLAG